MRDVMHNQSVQVRNDADCLHHVCVRISAHRFGSYSSRRTMEASPSQHRSMQGTPTFPTSLMMQVKIGTGNCKFARLTNVSSEPSHLCIWAPCSFSPFVRIKGTFTKKVCRGQTGRNKEGLGKQKQPLFITTTSRYRSHDHVHRHMRDSWFIFVRCSHLISSAREGRARK